MMEFTHEVSVHAVHKVHFVHALHKSCYIQLLFLVMTAIISAAPGAVAKEAPPSQTLDAAVKASISEDGGEAMRLETDGPPARWFLFFALVNTYPKLESERLIRKYFNPAMRMVAPGFDNVRTIGSLRDEHLLWPPHFGIGYVVSPKLALFLQAGYAAGTVRTKADDRSIFLVPLHTDFEIKRGATYLGLGVDYYPFDQPKRRAFHGIKDRLRNARPVLGLRFTETYATYEAKAKAGFSPFTHLLDLKLSDSWMVPSFNANVGVDIPVGKTDVLFLNAGYNFACDHKYDFDSSAFTVGWRHFFR